jgi:hypothetical protein
MNNENENTEESSRAYMRERILALIKRQEDVAYTAGFATGILIGSMITFLLMSFRR